MQPRRTGETPRSKGDRERAHGALIESLGVYRRLHDGAGEPIDYAIDFIRSTRHGGDAAVARLAGETLLNALPRELAADIQRGFDRALESCDSERFELSIDRRTVEVTVVPRTASEVIATFVDVTEARLAGDKLAREEIRFRRIVDAVQDYAIYMLDPEGRVASWNAGAARIKGYRADEILGRHFSRFYTPEDIATKLPDRELVDAQRFGRFEGEGWRIRKDGTRFWANVVISPIRDTDGKLLGFTKVTRDLTEDVTERREHEERMAKLLAREQAAVAEQVRARQQMEEALRGRDVFLAIAAHELRTPLTPMRLQVDAILRDLREPIGDAARQDRFMKKFRVIERQTHRLEALVSNLLDTSRIASGQLELHLEPVAIDELVRRVVQHYEADAAAAGCALDVTVTPELIAITDRARVEQIVANLVSNAIRYGAAKPVRVGATRDHSEIRITVRDEGIGVAGDDQRRIFERFERAASERHYGGLGLGLWITRQIVDALGGRIRLESELGRGSTFIVTLPMEHERMPGGT